jgi:hypothetical protein
VAVALVIAAAHVIAPPPAVAQPVETMVGPVITARARVRVPRLACLVPALCHPLPDAGSGAPAAERPLTCALELGSLLTRRRVTTEAGSACTEAMDRIVVTNELRQDGRRRSFTRTTRRSTPVALTAGAITCDCPGRWQQLVRVAWTLPVGGRWESYPRAVCARVATRVLECTARATGHN